MVIKASSRTQIDALIADLGSDRLVARDTAITRLTVIGGRALERLMALAGNPAAAPAARTAALRVLEAIGDARSLDVVLRAMDDAESTLAVPAARAFLRGPRGAAAVDRLTTMALDRERDEALRIAALHALSELDLSTLKPLYSALVHDPSVLVAAIAAHPDDRAENDPRPAPTACLKAAAEGELPDDPGVLRRAIASEGGVVSLTTLQRIIDRLGERERAEPQRRPEWMRVRGAAHAALAGRGSLVGLYDLRETLEAAAAPLPLEFLSALHRIGEASCLEAIAPAYARAEDEWWRRQLADAFRAITSRERITGRHAVMKRIQKRWPAILDEQLGGKAR